MNAPRSYRPVFIAILVGVTAVTALGVMAVQTRSVRRAVAVYTRLLAAANRQDMNELQQLCSARYLKTHELRPADEGGVVGFPRNIHSNFQAWRQGPHVWLCPTNRTGPVYQFLFEGGSWRFDGPVGILRGRNEFIPVPDEPVSQPEEQASSAL